MKIAYMLLVHNNFEQLKLLIAALDDSENTFFIHIDKKNEELFEIVKHNYKEKSNVIILNNRVLINRGGLSMVTAIINLMNEVNQNGDFDYISLISGQCFPIKSNYYIKDYLKKNYGNEYIEGNEIGDNFWRLKCYNLFSECKYNRRIIIRLIDFIFRKIQIFLKIKRGNLKNILLYKGSTWFTITHPCMKYVLEYLRENPKYIIDYNYSYAPDESFFHTIILNSEFKKNRINDDLYEIDWKNSRLGSPPNFTSKDSKKLINSQNLYARKFDISIDKEIISIMSEGKIN